MLPKIRSVERESSIGAKQWMYGIFMKPKVLTQRPMLGLIKQGQRRIG